MLHHPICGLPVYVAHVVVYHRTTLTYVASRHLILSCRMMATRDIWPIDWIDIIDDDDDTKQCVVLKQLDG